VVATTDASGQARRLELPSEVFDGVQVRRFRNMSNRLAWHHHLFLPMAFGSFLRSHIQEFDVVHLHMFRTTQNVLVRRYATRYRVPYVFSARGSLPRIVRKETAKAIFDLAYGKRVLRDASRHIASSHVEHLQYESMGVPSSRIATIHNGVDAREYESLPPRGSFARPFGLDGKRLITYLGRLNARKGLDYLLHAFAGLARTHADTVLVIAGPDDGYQRPLQLLAHRLAVDDRTVFPGLLTGPARLGVFVDSEVIVYPTSHEPFGLVPFEALLCGRPVIVTEDSGCGELIKEEGAGLTVPYGNATALEEALDHTLRGGKAIEDTVDRGRQLVVGKLNWARIASQVVALYEQVFPAG
jgi:glycosyltransferase involved in cell wall biosynthesis